MTTACRRTFNRIVATASHSSGQPKYVYVSIIVPAALG
jgi:hypothetical protein